MYDNPWLYNGEVVETIDEEYVGFVYLLTHQSSGRMYVGKKLSSSIKKLPPLKGKKNKRHKKVETDWRDYYSSSELVQQLVKEGEVFKRDILHFCKTKGELSYVELKEQVDRKVLLLPETYYNNIVQCRIHGNHVKSMWCEE